MLKNIDAFLKANGLLILLFGCLIPVALVVYPSPMDWGDDFALYILEAKSFFAHKPTAISFYLPNPYNTMYSAASAPPVYPLFIASWGTFFGFELASLATLQSLFLIGWGLVIFLFLQKSHRISAFLVAILVVYFPFCIEFKNEPIADYCFCFLALLSILFSLKKKKIHFILAGAFALLSFQTKTVGLFLPSGFLAYSIVSFLKSSRDTVFLKQLAYYFLSFALLFIGLLFFKEDDSKAIVGHYSGIVLAQQMGQSIRENMQIYQDMVVAIFSNIDSTWRFLSQWIHQLLFSLALIGILLQYSKRWTLTEFYFLFSAFFIFSFPNSSQGFRYLLPLLPFIAWYILCATSSLFHRHPSLKSVLRYSIFLILFLHLEFPIFQKSWQNRYIGFATLDKSANEIQLFQLIKNLNANSIICFKKARALALYSQQKSFCNSIKSSQEQTSLEMTHFKPTHFLIGTTDVLYNPALSAFLDSKKNELDTIYTTPDYTLLAWKK